MNQPHMLKILTVILQHILISLIMVIKMKFYPQPKKGETRLLLWILKILIPQDILINNYFIKEFKDSNEIFG